PIQSAISSREPDTALGKSHPSVAARTTSNPCSACGNTFVMYFLLPPLCSASATIASLLTAGRKISSSPHSASTGTCTLFQVGVGSNKRNCRAPSDKLDGTGYGNCESLNQGSVWTFSISVRNVESNDPVRALEYSRFLNSEARLMTSRE